LVEFWQLSKNRQSLFLRQRDIFVVVKQRPAAGAQLIEHSIPFIKYKNLKSVTKERCCIIIEPDGHLNEPARHLTSSWAVELGHALAAFEKQIVTVFEATRHLNG
jgi:hypothetical protein